VGCLEFLLEFIFEAVLEGYITLMQWIIPQKRIGNRFQIILKTIVGIVTGLLLITMLLGIFAMLSADEYIVHIGRYMIFIPLAISLFQIIIGIIMRIIARKK